MRRLAAALGIVVLALVAITTAAGALETAEFGIDRIGGKSVEIRAGKVTHGSVKLWNKTDHPVRVEVWPVAAHVDKAGAAALGGDATAVGWVRMSETEIVLPAHASRELEYSVHAPRKVDGEQRTVAIMAQSVAAAGTSEGVVQRMALVTHFVPAGPSSAGLGVLPWIALMALAVAGAAVGFRGRWGAIVRRPQVATLPA